MTEAVTDIPGLLSAARLPSMPQILLKLLEVCQSDTAGMTDIAKLVANDAALTARILGVANSAAYQRDGRKAGLVQSLNVLGFSMVKTLLISESVYQTFSGFPNTAQHDLGHFWRDALSTAVIARELAKAMAHPQVEEAYLAGLLHNAGRLALLAVVPQQYAPLHGLPDDASLCAEEARLLGLTHAEAGAWLVERWNLDSFMADSLRYHHEDPSRMQTAPPLVRIVHLAHWLAAFPPSDALPPVAGALCGLAAAELDTIRQRTAAQVDKAAGFIGIVLPQPPGPEHAPDLAAVSSAPVAPTDPARQRLGHEVRDMALLSDWTRALSRVTQAPERLTLLRQSAQVYFDLQDSLVLLQSGDGRSLLCVSAAQQRQRLLEFAVALGQGGGIAASALHRRLEWVPAGSPQCGLAEEQLLRAMQAQALVCIPLNTATHCLGVVVGATTATGLNDLRQRTRLLQAFADAAAAAMEAQDREAADIDLHIAQVRAEFVQRTRGMAHEVNNPLAILKSYLGVLDDKLARAEPVAHEVAVLGEELDRIGTLVGEFAGTLAPRPVPDTDLNQLVLEVVTLFQESRFLPPGAQIVQQPQPQPCMVAAAPDTLRQILVNLIKNAVEALPYGGDISVVSRGVALVDARRYCTLVVQDNGPGMPPAVVQTLFQPQESDKPGSNRGLGLSIVQGLVHKIGGHIRCSSSTAGTRFEVLVPAATTSGVPNA